MQIGRPMAPRSARRSRRHRSEGFLTAIPPPVNDRNRSCQSNRMNKKLDNRRLACLPPRVGSDESVWRFGPGNRESPRPRGAC